MLVSLDDFEKALGLAMDAIRRDELIIYPTDTVYGIGANALSEKAVKKVFLAKKRSKKPLSIVVCDKIMLQRYCYASKETMRILEDIFPGPFTAVLPKKYPFPEQLTPHPNIGVRVPEQFFILSLVKRLNLPITTTSANFSGEPSPVSVEDIPKKLQDAAKVVVDGGPCRYALESTVIDFTGPKPAILRRGAGLNVIERLGMK
ncbi:MAG: L-threonylcarbamoyladenylate synthase [Candidatus Micrarchaeota archaeon]